MLAAIGLRMKLWGLIALGVLVLVGGLWARWRIAASRAASATQKAEALEAVRETEARVAKRRLELSLKQRALREEIAARKAMDFFDQGWGP